MFPGKIVPKLFMYLFVYLFMWMTSFDNNLNLNIAIFLVVAGQCNLPQFISFNQLKNINLSNITNFTIFTIFAINSTIRSCGKLHQLNLKYWGGFTINNCTDWSIDIVIASCLCLIHIFNCL